MIDVPLPIAPIAGVALRYGAVALAAFAITQIRESGLARRDQRAEDAMDDLGEGVCFRRDGEQVNGTARFARTIRMGRNGPGVEIDASALGRLRFRRV
ncbi:hypothetical protein RGUI_2658 [Rhodovulum sp. P5]|uniref:hypothetical protein n=1 Tax=Rhodovulum sp. P5 TaxID=1564506 RepID=UPI0009C1D26E|nr:hypothetical protein [Rhodovulum sp. P5]ARE40799.1 hypothetical protein RGUI_2658 [Rhodovulum sp. P5]